MKSISLPLAFVVVVFALGCKGPEDSRAEYAYVSTPQAVLRDRVAAVFNKVGTVTSGQRLRVLERSQNRRFTKVRTDDGREGWLEQRYLVGQDVFDGFDRLTRENSKAPVQATAVARRLVNLHLDPARNSEAIYQIGENGKAQLLRRTSTPKSGLKKVKEKEEERNDSVMDEDSDKVQAPNASQDPLEDWWLVRDEQQHMGWVLGRMLDIEVPLEVAQYAEGQRIVAAFVLNQVPESKGSDKKIAQYAMLTTEPKDGLPFDFNQVRIFTWNGARTRYETAYRERLTGKLPFRVSTEEFAKEGVLPTFTARAVDKNGQISERKYRLNGPIVRRVPSATGAAAGQALAPEQRKPAR